MVVVAAGGENSLGARIIAAPLYLVIQRYGMKKAPDKTMAALLGS